MYSNSAHQPLQTANYNPLWHEGDERRKENRYLDRIAQLMGTNRLTLNSYGTIKLWEDGPNYQKVVKYVVNSQCHPNFKLNVVNIHRVWRRADDKGLFDISNRKLLWHGTKRTNIPQILNNGFRLPISGGQMFGGGIYFADRISKSSSYSDSDVTFLLLCEVGLGKIYSCKQPHNNWMSAPVGFDSVKANGTYVPDWTDNGNYIGSLIPFGRTAKCTKYDSHIVNFNEFIVYDPRRIIIRFLVEVNVQRVLNPGPLTLVSPRENYNDIVMRRGKTRKADEAQQPRVKRNSNLAIKTISSSASTAVPSSNNTVKSSKNLHSSPSVSAMKPKPLLSSSVNSNALRSSTSAGSTSAPLSNNTMRSTRNGHSYLSASRASAVTPLVISSVSSRASIGSTNASVGGVGRSYISSFTAQQTSMYTSSKQYTSSPSYMSPSSSVQPKWAAPVQKQSNCVIL